MSPFWMTLFLDLATADHDPGLAFWRDASGYAVSSPRGEGAEFVSLLPGAGDAHLGVQRLGTGPSRVHLDLHVAVIEDAAGRAQALGARVVAERGYVVMESPAGFPFCLVGHAAAAPAAPTTWEDGHRSQVDQLCIDVPAEAYDAECRFWGDLTGWQVEQSDEEEFRRLRTPAHQALRVLLQRLGEPSGPARGHVDVATDDVAAEVARLEFLGARVTGVFEWWTAMQAPGGVPVCVTKRAPRS